MAYLKDLVVLCALCKVKRASKEVFDRWNGSIGRFCVGCAKRKLKERQGIEDQADRELTRDSKLR